MPDYSVEWRIEVTAENPGAAAREAWRLMRARLSTANHFHVYDELGECEEIDLQTIDEGKAGGRAALCRQCDRHQRHRG